MKLLIEKDWVRKFGDMSDMDEHPAGAATPKKKIILYAGMRIVFREIDRDHPDREMPARRGIVTYLYQGSEQLGASYEDGITKVWVCEDDIEVGSIV